MWLWGATLLLMSTFIKYTFACALCVPSDSDPNFQKSYQNLTTFGGKSYLIQTQNSDLAEIIKGENFN